MSSPYGGKIQAMFDLYDQISESICTPSDKRYDKQKKTLKQLRELKPSESYNNIRPNIPYFYCKSDYIVEEIKQLIKQQHK